MAPIHMKNLLICINHLYQSLGLDPPLIYAPNQFGHKTNERTTTKHRFALRSLLQIPTT